LPPTPSKSFNCSQKPKTAKNRQLLKKSSVWVN
jgi:hypothetical protein